MKIEHSQNCECLESGPGDVRDCDCGFKERLNQQEQNQADIKSKSVLRREEVMKNTTISNKDSLLDTGLCEPLEKAVLINNKVKSREKSKSVLRSEGVMTTHVTKTGIYSKSWRTCASTGCPITMEEPCDYAYCSLCREEQKNFNI